jgi:Toprim domain
VSPFRRGGVEAQDAPIGLDIMDSLTGGRPGPHDVPCPLCGPLKRSARGRRKRTLRIWRVEPGFATYYCARCSQSGFTRDHYSSPPDPIKLAKAHAEIAQHRRIITAARLSMARWLWSRRRPVFRSVVQTYLAARGYRGTIPPTLGFLPASKGHPPALIAAFGFATEVEPGVIRIADDAVVGVHLIKLKPDGGDRLRDDDLDDDDEAKITIGKDIIAPIILAPFNDLLGLCIAEGIEDALIAHQATELGAWAAGSASRMPGLGDLVPSYTETVTIAVDDNDAGHRGSAGLAQRLHARGIEILLDGRLS